MFAEFLPFELDSNWVNMDKIEYDKLEWMKDLSVEDGTVKVI